MNKVKLVMLFTILVMLPKWSHADTLQWQLPGGIGTVQLPWQATEVFFGSVIPFKGGLTQQIAGASLPILSLGKYGDNLTMVDGQVGAAGTWPVQGPFASPYLAIGHNFAKDIPMLEDFESLHINGCITYLTNQGGFYGGGTVSYAFGSF